MARRTTRWQFAAAAVIVALVVVPLAYAALSGSASGTGEKRSAPCWRRLLGDWSRNGIDRPYPIACYHSALDNLPEDVRVYTTAPGDIRRALREALRGDRVTAR